MIKYQVLHLQHVGVSKNSGVFPSKSSILIGFSIIFTIHFGVPLLLETPMSFMTPMGNHVFSHQVVLGGSSTPVTFEFPFVFFRPQIFWMSMKVAMMVSFCWRISHQKRGHTTNFFRNEIIHLLSIVIGFRRFEAVLVDVHPGKIREDEAMSTTKNVSNIYMKPPLSKDHEHSPQVQTMRWSYRYSMHKTAC